MSFPLSNIMERINRSLFEAVRLTCVENGYLPDITLYPDTDLGVADFKADMAAIVVGPKGFAIELFGAGSTRKKYAKASPRIVITPRNTLPGYIGAPSNLQTQESPLAPGEYQGVIYPALSSRYLIDINLVGNTAMQEIILHQILFASVQRMGYVDFYDEPDKRFFIRCINNLDISDPEENYLEKSYLWEVPDIYEAGEKVIIPVIKPITEVTVEPYLGLEEADGKDSDLVVVP